MSTLKKEMQAEMIQQIINKTDELSVLAKQCAGFGISVEFLLSNHKHPESGNCYQSAEVTTAAWISEHV